jgi:ketosteroid isomerase-like protein
LREFPVHTGDDIAFGTGLLDCGSTEGDRPVQYTLRLTLGLTKTPDGWRIVHEHSSEPTPFDVEGGRSNDAVGRASGDRAAALA